MYDISIVYTYIVVYTVLYKYDVTTTVSVPENYYLICDRRITGMSFNKWIIEYYVKKIETDE